MIVCLLPDEREYDHRHINWQHSHKMNGQMRFVCINCGHGVKELFKKYSNTLKTTQCVRKKKTNSYPVKIVKLFVIWISQDKCHQITDKYIEFEEFIILIDALLLNSFAFRHIIYNGDFKVIDILPTCFMSQILNNVLRLAVLEDIFSGAAIGILCAMPTKAYRFAENRLAYPRERFLYIYASKYRR